MIEQEIREIIQKTLSGKIIPCKNPKKLTVEEFKNGLKTYETEITKNLLFLISQHYVHKKMKGKEK
jgi:hypothetical protein